MDYQSDADALRALARDQASRSKIGRVREIFEDIEATQRAGVSNKKIVETLNARGYDLTPKTFESILYRIRQERAKLDELPATTQTSIIGQQTIESSNTEIPGTSASRKITNPNELRRSRERDIDLDNYAQPEIEDG